MTIGDGAERLYRDSKIGLTVNAVVGIIAAAALDILSALPALASSTVGVAVGTLAGVITAWKAKHIAPVG